LQSSVPCEPVVLVVRLDPDGHSGLQSSPLWLPPVVVVVIVRLEALEPSGHLHWSLPPSLPPWLPPVVVVVIVRLDALEPSGHLQSSPPWLSPPPSLPPWLPPYVVVVIVFVEALDFGGHSGSHWSSP
jgi:hypothetical protein